MNVEEYAKTHEVDIETAMTHLMLISMIETFTSSAQYRQWMFTILVQSVDPHKFAAAASAWTREILATAAAQTPESDSSAEMT